MTSQTSRRKKLNHPVIDGREMFTGASSAGPVTPQELADDHAERGVIGAVLQQPELFWSLSEQLQAVDFFWIKHRWIWLAFEQMAEAKEPIELQTVGRWLDRQNGAIKGDDARDLLADLYGAPFEPEHAETYASHVREAALRLRTLDATRAIQVLMCDRSRSVQSAVDEANRLLFEATDQHLGLTDTSAAACAQDYLDLMQSRMRLDQRRGVAYGFERFDNPVNFTGGLYPGDVTVLCGHEGYGKTTFVLTVARNALLAGKHVVIFTLEMRREEIIQVFVSQETGIPKTTLRDGSLDFDEFDAMSEAVGRIGAWNMHIIDDFRGGDNPLTPLALRRRLRVLLAQQPVDLVIIDGLWLMEPNDDRERGGKERWHAVGNIMYGLADIAKGEAGLPVPILITQQYRVDAWHVKKPTLDLVAESSGVRRTAMVIIGLWRTDAGFTEAHILKDRAGGNAGHICLFDYDKDRSAYRERRI